MVLGCTPIIIYGELIYVSMEEIENTSVWIFAYSARRWKILRTYDLLLSNFQLILPKFHFLSRWRLFVFHIAI